MPVNYEVLSIVFSVIDGLVVILTLFRLGFRLKIQRFGWEDVWAAIASLCVAVSIFTLPTLLGSGESATIVTKIRVYMSISVVWSVRMSLMFSIMRITSSTLLRRILLATAACLVLFWAAAFGLRSWSCVQNMKVWVGHVGPNCVLPSFIPIFEVMCEYFNTCLPNRTYLLFAPTNIVADVVTVLFSLQILWRVKLPPRQRRMMLYLFTSSIYLSVVSLVNALIELVGSKGAKEILAYLQVTVFMIVCNLVVVVTFVYRVFWISRGDDSPSESQNSSYDDDFTKPFPTTQNLTTVDLGAGLTGFTSELGSNCYDSTAPATLLENSSDLLEET